MTLFDAALETDIGSSGPSWQPAKNIKKKQLSVTGLFAGIGGLEEGFRQNGHHSVMLCELDPLARHVLKKHFPQARIATDVTKLNGIPHCDVLTAELKS